MKKPLAVSFSCGLITVLPFEFDGVLEAVDGFTRENHSSSSDYAGDCADS